MDTASAASNKTVVDLQSVHLFRGESVVLADVNIQIRAGEFCYIIGRTGSGKSTLLKAMYGALPLRKGHAVMAGMDLISIRRKDIPKLRRKLGMVFQDFRLLADRDVHDNLDYVLRATGWKKKSDREDRIEECLRVVDLLDKLKAYPDQLSGGEKQRIAISRAILNEPRLIIADEPTGNLDPQTSDEIMYLFHRLSTEHDTAVLLATHDYRIIDKFPARIYRCVNGQIFEEEV